jgi:pilus assembly protein CpaC
VPAAADAQRAEAIARAYGGEDREVVNSLTLLSSIQVNLRVRVAEVSRQISRELGFNWQTLANDGGGLLIGLATTGSTGALATQVARRLIAPPSRVGRGGYDINAVVDALASDQLISILAEPNLTAQSGEVASFLAGGEFPVPIAASPLTNTITIEYKQFGVSLAFVPTVLGPDRVNLRVRPEVSELSENGAISVPLASGVVKIPALSVRRAETTVELGSGQSFAIAGLLQRSNTMVNSGINGLRDIPVLGALFGSDRFRRNETELVIIITPYLVRPVSDPRALAAPTDGFRPATDLDRILFRRQLDRGSPAREFRSGLDAGFIIE